MTALAISNIVLWIVVLALLVVVLALTRQLGVLHERLSRAEQARHHPANANEMT